MKKAINVVGSIFGLALLLVPMAAVADGGGIKILASCQLDTQNVMTYNGTDSIDTNSPMYKDVINKVTQLKVTTWEIDNGEETVVMTSDSAGIQGFTNNADLVNNGTSSMRYEYAIPWDQSGGVDFTLYVSRIAGSNKMYRGILVVDWLDYASGGQRIGGPIFLNFNCSWIVPPSNLGKNNI